MEPREGGKKEEDGREKQPRQEEGRRIRARARADIKSRLRHSSEYIFTRFLTLRSASGDVFKTHDVIPPS